jgi:hypothetical protein
VKEWEKRQKGEERKKTLAAYFQLCVPIIWQLATLYDWQLILSSLEHRASLLLLCFAQNFPKCLFSRLSGTHAQANNSHCLLVDWILALHLELFQFGLMSQDIEIELDSLLLTLDRCSRRNLFRYHSSLKWIMRHFINSAGHN